MTPKCKECKTEMEKTGEDIVHNKELDVFECPKCGDIEKVEVKR